MNEERKIIKNFLLIICALIVIIVAVCFIKGCFVDDNINNYELEKSANDVSNVDTTNAQIELIMNNKDMWMFTEEELGYGECGYAVTDLDHNGRLEIIASSCQGTGLYTYSKFFEVNENLDGIKEVKQNITEGESEADIMVLNVKQYYDASSNRYYYIFEDVIRNGAWGHVIVKKSLLLEKGKLKVIDLVSLNYEVKDKESDEYEYYMNYYDASGESITDDEYDNILKNAYKDFKGDLISMDFIMTNNNDDITSDILTKSYRGFGNIIDENELNNQYRDEVYKNAVEDIKNNFIMPNGDRVESGEEALITENSYAINDIDKDGKDELIISWKNTLSTARNV